MPTEGNAGAVREAVRIFHDAKAFVAIDELLSSGFHRAEPSLLASRSAVEEKLGHRDEKVAAMADDAAVPRAAYELMALIAETPLGA